MDTHKFLPFLIIASIIFVILDLYFLISWTNFVKSKKWNKLSYQSFWAISIIVLIISGISVYLRAFNYIPSEIMKFLLSFSSIWYLPKIIIVPIIAIKDLIKYISNLILNYRFRYGNSSVRTIDNSNHNQRREFLQTSAWLAAGVPFLMVADGMIRTTYNFKVHHVEIPMYKLPKALDGIRILQISDIHAGSFLSTKPMKEVEFIISTIKPDMITLTGDFVNFNPNELPLIIESLSQLKAEIGVYACLGNHDHYMSPKEHKNLISIIKSSGIDLLINESRILKVNNEKLQLAGTDNSSYRMKFGDIKKSLYGLDEIYPTIILCHDPTNWDKDVRGKTSVDLMLSGHTHGGQVGIELFGQELTPARLVYNQYAGLYRDKDQYLYINRGIGTVGPPVRIGIDPEITVITLKSISQYA